VHSRLEHVWREWFRCTYCGCYVQLVVHAEYTRDELVRMVDRLLEVESSEGEQVGVAAGGEADETKGGEVVCQR